MKLRMLAAFEYSSTNRDRSDNPPSFDASRAPQADLTGRDGNHERCAAKPDRSSTLVIPRPYEGRHAWNAGPGPGCRLDCSTFDGAPNFYVGGSSLNDIASKFVKCCWVPLLGMVTWSKT